MTTKGYSRISQETIVQKICRGKSFQVAFIFFFFSCFLYPLIVKGRELVHVRKKKKRRKGKKKNNRNTNKLKARRKWSRN